MKNKKNIQLLLLCVSIYNTFFISAYAATAKFNIVPTSGTYTTTFVLPTNYTETVSYTITNQTHLTRTLTLVQMPGVAQVLGSGLCDATFQLSPNQSCTLQLSIIGSKIPASGILGGPVICKTKRNTDPSPDLLLCSQPSTNNLLEVSSTRAIGSYVYVLNQLGNSMSRCQAGVISGHLTNCEIIATGFSGPEGIGFNPSGTLVYVANFIGSNITMCNVNSVTGAISGCMDAGGSGFSNPNGIAFSPDGSILYTSNAGSDTVSACVVSATSGLLSACVANSDPTFHTPADLTVNANGNLAYIANFIGDSISICNVTGQTLSDCVAFQDSLIDRPEGATLNSQGNFLYITNTGVGSKNVAVCNVDSTGALSDCVIASDFFRGTGNVALNTSSTLSFTPNFAANIVYTCYTNIISGLFNNCALNADESFDGPSGIALNPVP